ncbi:H/ACA RNA-protein complex component Gar1 [Methanobrevibacter cuticularis]|uniref:H/ACA RNA-protein complex component Gar1 n=1 Tax=Methanobrevibacter cuticularis TaxID=47311 RepID=A0A166CZ50_9EURY|nr:Gar1/Naf1 family protein [Methanobrevibacter cuticularis]KZX15021.1 H/ACA RNA-protein complex component Gar1 [Methanobrevibacter cuticularis]
MKFLGNISHLSNSGKLIARSSQTPPAGAFVFNKDKKKIGKVIEVFGPTKEPYISISMFRSVNLENSKLDKGNDLYVSINKKKKGRRTRKKR